MKRAPIFYTLSLFFLAFAHEETVDQLQQNTELDNESIHSDRIIPEQVSPEAAIQGEPVIPGTALHVHTEVQEEEEKVEETIHHEDMPSVVVSYPYKEYLNFQPLERNNLLASFNFEMNSSAISLYPEEDDVSHYSSFSKLLGPILQSTNTRELHLRFSQGWYDAQVYGKLINNGDISGGTGVELWALIEGESQEDVFENWTKLSNALSGLFCASLNFIDSSSTTFPATLFQPKSSLLDSVSLKNNLYLLRSSLPREPVCTENLTPFLKLLPTKGKAGISSLLTGHKVFNSQWSSMSIDILTECKEDSQCFFNMKQSINLILNVPKVLERNKMPIPKPTPGDELRCDLSKKHDAYHCFPLPESTEWSYDLNDLFGKEIQGGALISSEPSEVSVKIDNEAWDVDIHYRGKVMGSIDSNNSYEFKDIYNYNIAFKTSDSKKIVSVEQPPIYASRSLSGYSQDRGGFRLDLYNPSEDPVKVVIFESLPWFMRIYLHTITISLNNSETYKINDDSDIINEIIYDPSIDRVRPTHLELLLTIPAQTKLKISFEFDKAMLLYAEYPPDANHGFEIPPSVISLLDSKTNKVIYTLRTTTSLLTLPTPDFSMPYNVIILTSTVMSLAFGSIFNLLIKRTVTEQESEYLVAKAPLTKFLNKIKEGKLLKVLIILVVGIGFAWNATDGFQNLDINEILGKTDIAKEDL